MSLTVEQKNKLIDSRIREYEVKIFELEMNKKALQSAGDVEGIEHTEQRIEALRSAIKAVEEMRE